jgi:deazaflavin-dependent oxidoreductase (nitroreductase family)
MDFKEWNKAVIAEFRANGGKVGGDIAHLDVLLLHTTGAKSGAERINPLAYLKEGDTHYVFASMGGAPRDPDWYHNVLANPAVGVEVGTERFDATASEVTGAERDRIYAQVAAKWPQFADYEKATDRVIPVVALTRA